MGMYVLARDLSTFRNKSAINVRVHDEQLVLFTVKKMFSAVHAHIPKTLVDNFRHSFVEQKVYVVKNFFVITNFYTYKTSPHRFMLKFNADTILKEFNFEKFPWHMYRLRPFPSLKDGEVKLCSYDVTQVSLDKDLTSELHLSDGDDDSDEGFLSDEADGPVATLGMTIPHEGSEGPVKRSLLDELSSTKESKKTRESVVKVEKID
nr:replication protein A 70 kDa DNA-binding subunit D-like [Ipomoea batatas]